MSRSAEAATNIRPFRWPPASPTATATTTTAISSTAGPWSCIPPAGPTKRPSSCRTSSRPTSSRPADLIRGSLCRSRSGRHRHRRHGLHHGRTLTRSINRTASSWPSPSPCPRRMRPPTLWGTPSSRRCCRTSRSALRWGCWGDGSGRVQRGRECRHHAGRGLLGADCGVVAAGSVHHPSAGVWLGTGPGVKGWVRGPASLDCR